MKRVRCKQDMQRGAILLEALVAVVVLTIGLTAVLQAMMSHYRGAVLAQEYYQASQALGDSLAASMISASGTDKAPDGSCLEESERYECSITSKDTIPSPEPEVVFDQAQVRLEWPSGQGKRAIEVPFYWARGRE